MPKDFSLRIKKLRKTLGLTQHALAEKLGVLPWAVSSWEQGRWEPSGEHYAQLARLAGATDGPFFLKKIGIDRETLTTLAGPAVLQTPEVRIYTTEKWRPGTEDRLRFQVQIPVLKDEAAAGSPRLINELDVDSFIAVPSKFVPRGLGSYTGIYIKGDSMEPILSERAIVVVDHASREVTALRGRMVAAIVQEGVLVKWLSRESRKDRVVLHSQNPEYEDIVVESAERDPIVGEIVFWWGLPPRNGYR